MKYHIVLFHTAKNVMSVSTCTNSFQPHEREFRSLWEHSVCFGLKLWFVFEKSKDLQRD